MMCASRADVLAFRTCGTSGEWIGNYSNYSQCIPGYVHVSDILFQKLIAILFVILYIWVLKL